MHQNLVISSTRQWVEKVVVGLDLCPFARRELVRDRIRFAVTTAESPDALLDALGQELELLDRDDGVETTLLIHPLVLQDFYDYNDFLADADHLLAMSGREGVYQIASFHPAYQFGGTRSEDVENYTNRSPYPMLHLLREASLERAIAAHPDPDGIPQRNIERMEQLGIDTLRRLLTSCLAFVLCFLLIALVPGTARAETATLAAASGLRFALDDIVAEYSRQYPDDQLRVIYGSSGKMTTQILNGAPYDLFFSADIRYPRRLVAAGMAASEPRTYALGRLVIWHNKAQRAPWDLDDLASAARQGAHIAIAQPRHAPYGARAKEALTSAGLWELVEPRLVYGENIAQTASMVRSGAADAGLIALSIALFPDMEDQGYSLVDDSLHQPLTQGYVITRQGADNPTAQSFAGFMETDTARTIMERYGFTLPEDETLPEPDGGPAGNG